MSENKKPYEPFYRPLSQVYIEAAKEMIEPPAGFSIPGWPYFNKCTGGIRMHEFSILSGPSGIGKTTFIAGISKALMLGGVKHLVASIETGHTDFIKRILSGFADKDLNTGDPIPKDEVSKLHDRVGDILLQDNLLLSLFDNRVKCQRMVEEVQHAVINAKVKVVIIDNLNFMLEVTRASDALIEMDRVIHTFVMMMKKLPVHMIMIMHPRKTLSGHVESMNDIRGSINSIQEAQNVFLLNPPTKDQMQQFDLNSRDRVLKFEKLRKRGMNTGKQILFRTENGINYTEGRML